MTSRGETQFRTLPRFAARLYATLTRTRSLQRQYQDIAALCTRRVQSGRLLDVGTGPGWLLPEVHRQAPELQLYGLDISPAMIDLARQHLRGVTRELKVAEVGATGYEDGFFDAVICSGSFYLWDRPEEGLEEIHRILRPGGRAQLFETDRDYDRKAYQAALRANLKQEGLAMRLFGPLLLGKALPMAYRAEEVEAIVRRTSFAGHCRIEKVTLAGLPIWMHIQLTRQ